MINNIVKFKDKIYQLRYGIVIDAWTQIDGHGSGALGFSESKTKSKRIYKILDFGIYGYQKEIGIGTSNSFYNIEESEIISILEINSKFQINTLHELNRF